MWHVVGGDNSLIFSSLGLMVCDLWYFEDFEEKDYSLKQRMHEWMNEWISDKGVCRTSSAIPGLEIFTLV